MFNNEFNNEIIHGFNAGIAQSLIGHPLDTIKTWIQMQTYNKEKHTLRNLYRGFSYPAFTNGVITGISFHAYTFCKNKDEKYGMLSGSIATGIITTLLCAYPEYKKISKQMNIRNAKKYPYQTFLTLTMREIPASICYYPVYDLLRNRNYNIPLSGGLAGVVCWLSSYWADVLNTKVMTGITIKQALLSTKFIDYFKGLEIVIPRAFLVNSFGYYFYELSKDIID